MHLLSMKKAGPAWILLFCGVSSIFFFCMRDNPMDAKNPTYIPGKKPHAQFATRSISAFLYDSVTFKIICSDTARGGKKGAIKEFYFDWNGDTIFRDTMNGTTSDTFLFSKTFPPGSMTVRLKAEDDEGIYSDIDSTKLMVLFSKPQITALSLPKRVELGASAAAIVTLADTGGKPQWLLWAQNGVDFKDSTSDSVFVLNFSKTGIQTVLIKMRDNKGVESSINSARIDVFQRFDTTGPMLLFLSPRQNDSVATDAVTVYLQAEDISNVNSVTVNDVPLQLSGGVWKGTVTVMEGKNKLRAFATDFKGNTSADSITLFYSSTIVDKTPPVIIRKNPPGKTDTVTIPRLTVKVFAADPSGIAAVYLSKSMMQKDTIDGSYDFTSALIGGNNIFSIKSIDMKGNFGFDTLSIYYADSVRDTTSPLLSIFTPKAFQHIADTMVTVKGAAIDASGLSSVRVNNVEASRNYPDWSGMVKLQYGYDTIIVTASDSSPERNKAAGSVIVIRNSPPHFTVESSNLDTQLTIGAAYAITVRASDLENDSLHFRLLSTYFRSASVPLVSALGSGVNLKYVPNAKGTDTFSLEVKDSWNDADTLRWTVSVFDPADSAPFFAPSRTTLPDTVTALGRYSTSVKAIDPGNRHLYYSLLKPPTPSAMIIDSQGTITWNPIENDTGIKRIVVMVGNGRQQSSLQWDLTVRPYDWPPVLTSPGDKSIDENKLLRFSLVATDKNGDPLEFFLGPGLPAGARIDSTEFSWTPSYNDAGTYSLAFIVRELHRTPALSDSQTISIIVNNVNNPPALTNPGNKTVNENQLLQFTLSAADVNGDAITYSMSGAPTGAGLTNNQFGWTPTYAQSGSYNVTFLARDNGVPQMSDSQTINITVNNMNNPPALTNPGNKTVNENQLLQFTLSAADVNGDAVTYSMNGAPTGAGLSDNQFNWTPTYTQSGSYSVKFFARDNGMPQMSDSQTISITVNNVNNPPTLTNPGNKNVNENQLLQFTLSAADVNGDAITYSMSGAPTGASLINNQFNWKPTYAQSGSYGVKFFAWDNGIPQMSDSQTISITVNNVNNPPMLTNPGNKNVNENQLLQFTLSATDVNGDAVTYSMNGAPTGAGLTNNQFSWKPTYAQSGSYGVKFFARDNGVPQMSDSQIISITVNNVNNPPMLTNPGNKTVNENQLLQFMLSAADVNGDAITYSMSGAPTGAGLTNNQFKWKPTYAQKGSYSVKFYAMDNGAPPMSDSQAITIAVNYVNVAPVLTNPGDKSVNENQDLQFDLSAIDANNEFLSYTIINAPSGATLTVNRFDWTPAIGQAGSYPVIFKVSDSGTPILSDSASITITVNAGP
jgi:hypothetical protein